MPVRHGVDIRVLFLGQYPNEVNSLAEAARGAGTFPPSPADQLLIDHPFRHTFTEMLEVWRSRRLLPGNISGGGLGRGKGSTSRPAPESCDLVLGGVDDEFQDRVPRLCMVRGRSLRYSRLAVDGSVHQRANTVTGDDADGAFGDRLPPLTATRRSRRHDSTLQV
ncbi:hypothetical protein [Streptomyces sp. NPDC096033]|uniref:hypothetical protein n=1 Tax=Streptomyces sp. NPDC096033 TaxID=3366071 RepID=UPI0038170EF6